MKKITIALLLLGVLSLKSFSSDTYPFLDFYRNHSNDSVSFIQAIESYDQKTKDLLNWQFNFQNSFNPNLRKIEKINLELSKKGNFFIRNFYYLLSQGDYLFWSYPNKNVEARDSYVKALDLALSHEDSFLVCEALKRVLDLNRYSYLIDNNSSVYYLELYEKYKYDELEEVYYEYYRQILSFQYFYEDRWNMDIEKNLINYADTSSNIYFNARIYQLVSSYYDLVNKLSTAIKFEKKAIELLSSKYIDKYSTLLKISQISLSRYYLRNSQASLADSVLESYDRKTKNKLEEEYRRYLFLYKFAVDTVNMDYEAAYLNLWDYVGYSELSNLYSNQNRIQEIEAQYQTKQREAEVEQQRNQLEYQNRWIIGISIFLFILLVLSLSLIFAWRSIRSKNHKIESLMRELHHRVKNNLQVISSLLSLQSMKLEDQGAKKAVDEGKERIRAMSLIHQKLYQNEEVTSLDLKDYLTNLVNELTRSYGYHDKAKVSLEIPSLVLDADTSLPLGLIVNELVTNSYKYAFEGIQNPELNLNIEKEGNNLTLNIKDNGVGLPDNFNLEKSTSFGMKLVGLLTRQLGGKLKVLNEQGVGYQFTFQV